MCRCEFGGGKSKVSVREHFRRLRKELEAFSPARKDFKPKFLRILTHSDEGF